MGFKNAIELAPWENILAVENVNDKLCVLENYTNDILDKFAPFKTFTVKKPNHTPWIGTDIQKMMDTRDSLKYDYNATRDQSKFDAYKYYRNRVTSARRRAQSKMFNETINNSAGNSKKFYEASKKLGVLPMKNDNCHTHFFTAENLTVMFPNPKKFERFHF